MQTPIVMTESEVRTFLAWCNGQHIENKIHPSVMHHGYLIKQGKHWMGILWNKQRGAFTFDKRLAMVHKQFKHQCEKALK